MYIISFKSRVKSNKNSTKLKCSHFFFVWYKEYFCSGDRNVCPIEKSFAQQEKKIRGNIGSRGTFMSYTDYSVQRCSIKHA